MQFKCVFQGLIIKFNAKNSWRNEIIFVAN